MGSPYRVSKLVFSYPCTVRPPLGVSMALDRACIVKCKFTQCVVTVPFRVTVSDNCAQRCTSMVGDGTTDLCNTFRLNAISHKIAANICSGEQTQL